MKTTIKAVSLLAAALFMLTSCSPPSGDVTTDAATDAAATADSTDMMPVTGVNDVTDAETTQPGASALSAPRDFIEADDKCFYNGSIYYIEDAAILSSPLADGAMSGEQLYGNGSDDPFESAGVGYPITMLVDEAASNERGGAPVFIVDTMSHAGSHIVSYDSQTGEVTQIAGVGNDIVMQIILYRDTIYYSTFDAFGSGGYELCAVGRDGGVIGSLKSDDWAITILTAYGDEIYIEKDMDRICTCGLTLDGDSLTDVTETITSQLVSGEDEIVLINNLHAADGGIYVDFSIIYTNPELTVGSKRQIARLDADTMTYADTVASGDTVTFVNVDGKYVSNGANIETTWFYDDLIFYVKSEYATSATEQTVYVYDTVSGNTRELLDSDDYGNITISPVVFAGRYAVFELTEIVDPDAENYEDIMGETYNVVINIDTGDIDVIHKK